MAEERAEEETKGKKYNSRKFIVWLAATIFEGAALAWAFITKDAKLAQEFTPWWGGISMLYIGGNVAQKFAPEAKE